MLRREEKLSLCAVTLGIVGGGELEVRRSKPAQQTLVIAAAN